MPNIRNFAGPGFQGDLPPGLQPNIPRQVNFGGPPQQAPQQQITQSQILGALLSGQLGNIPQDQGNAFGGLQNAILQKGQANALQGQRDQAGISQAANVPFTPRQPDINQLRQFQGRDFSRF